MDSIILFSKTVVQQPRVVQSKLIRLFLKQNLLSLLDLSWWPLINLSSSVNFIMERNSSLSIELRGNRLQEGKRGRNMDSEDCPK